MRPKVILIALIFIYYCGIAWCFTQSTKTLSVARYFVASTSVGNYALFGGGSQGIEGPVSNLVDIYNADTNIWSTYNFARDRAGVAATSVGRYALFAGGIDISNGLNPPVNDVDIFDSVTGTWTNATLSQARSQFAATSVGKYALFGGGFVTSTNASLVVDIFNSETLEWTTATLSVARGGLAATTAGRYAFFAGGNYGSDATSTVDIFDSITGTWNTTTLSAPRESLSATSLGNFALFAGGSRNGTYSDVVDIYDTVSQTWSTPLTLSTQRSVGAATTVGNFALFGGGYNGATQNRVDLFQLGLSNSFALSLSVSQTNLNMSRFYISATTVGPLAMFAGGMASNSNPTDMIDVYDFSSQFEPATKPTYNIVPILECIDQDGIAQFGYRNNEAKTVVLSQLSRNYLAPHYVFPVITFTPGRTGYYPLNSGRIPLKAQGSFTWQLDNYVLNFDYNSTAHVCPTTINIIITSTVSGDYGWNTTKIALAMQQVFVNVTGLPDTRVLIVRVNPSKKKSVVASTELVVELSVEPPASEGDPTAAEVVQKFVGEQTDAFESSINQQTDVRAMNVTITIKDVDVNPTPYVEGTVPVIPPVQEPIEPITSAPIVVPSDDSVPMNSMPQATVPIVFSAAVQSASFWAIGCLVHLLCHNLW